MDKLNQCVIFCPPVINHGFPFYDLLVVLQPLGMRSGSCKYLLSISKAVNLQTDRVLVAVLMSERT